MRRFQFVKRRERGSLTVEAILFLIPFMCAFLTLINTARYVQAEMLIHHAITQTAKQVSAYGYVLTKADIVKRMQDTHKKSEDFQKDTEEMIQSVTGFVEAVGEIGSSGDLVLEIDTVVTEGVHASDTVTEYFSDPKEIMKGALAIAKSSGQDEITTWAVGAIARGNIKKSLEKVTDDPDGYLKTIGIVDGMAGLDFSQSKCLSNNGGKGNVDIVVTYQLKNLLFPDFDFGEHEFCQCASTLIW